MRVAAYVRVSTADQELENQLREIRAYVSARGWTLVREYSDAGISGTVASRPALDQLLADAKRRRFDVIVVWTLDRLGRSLKNLVTLLDEFSALGVSFVSLRESIDWTTPAGRMQTQILAVLAEWQRGRIVERVRAGMARARAQGKHLGRPRTKVTDADLAATADLSVREAASRLGVSKSFVARWRLSQRVA